MNKTLKKIAFFIGLGILGISVYWSKNGFNFGVAGDSGGSTEAIAIGWFLAIAVTALQFIFSSNFRELNSSLVLLGLGAYAYSIYTNYQGILEFQGTAPNRTWAITLSVILDATAEPMIAWSLGVSREGDMIGNIIKAFRSSLDGIFSSASEQSRRESDKPDKAKNHRGERGESAFDGSLAQKTDFLRHLDERGANLHGAKSKPNSNRYHLR